MSRFDLADKYRAVVRSVWYVYSDVEDYPTMQQKGMVTIVDFGGQWLSSPFQMIRFGSMYPADSIPVHDVCMHFLYNVQ